jgi:hypothetical protein
MCQAVNRAARDKREKGQVMIGYIERGELKKIRALVAEMGRPKNIDFTSI